jgi:nicotinamide/nicotinate riboside kinase
MTRLIGIGGSSCSGKSTITNLLSHLLDGPIVHQDAFYRPDSLIPLLNGVPNWDCPGAIDFDRFHATLRRIKNGSSEQILGPNRPEMNLELTRNKEIAKLVQRIKDSKVKVVMVDGFLLYADQVTSDLLDVSIFLCAPFEVLKSRRERRKTYVTPEGHWEDPPGYFEKIVWPMYEYHNSRVLDHSLECVKIIDTHFNSIDQVLILVLQEIAKNVYPSTS